MSVDLSGVFNALDEVLNDGTSSLYNDLSDCKTAGSTMDMSTITETTDANGNTVITYADGTVETEYSDRTVIEYANGTVYITFKSEETGGDICTVSGTYNPNQSTTIQSEIIYDTGDSILTYCDGIEIVKYANGLQIKRTEEGVITEIYGFDKWVKFDLQSLFDDVKDRDEYTSESLRYVMDIYRYFYTEEITDLEQFNSYFIEYILATIMNTSSGLLSSSDNIYEQIFNALYDICFPDDGTDTPTPSDIIKRVKFWNYITAIIVVKNDECPSFPLTTDGLTKLYNESETTTKTITITREGVGDLEVSDLEILTSLVDAYTDDPPWLESLELANAVLNKGVLVGGNSLKVGESLYFGNYELYVGNTSIEFIVYPTSYDDKEDDLLRNQMNSASLDYLIYTSIVESMTLKPAVYLSQDDILWSDLNPDFTNNINFLYDLLYSSDFYSESAKVLYNSYISTTDDSWESRAAATATWQSQIISLPSGLYFGILDCLTSTTDANLNEYDPVYSRLQNCYNNPFYTYEFGQGGKSEVYIYDFTRDHLGGTAEKSYMELYELIYSDVTSSVSSGSTVAYNQLLADVNMNQKYDSLIQILFNQDWSGVLSYNDDDDVPPTNSSNVNLTFETVTLNDPFGNIVLVPSSVSDMLLESNTGWTLNTDSNTDSSTVITINGDDIDIGGLLDRTIRFIIHEDKKNMPRKIYSIDHPNVTQIDEVLLNQTGELYFVQEGKYYEIFAPDVPPGGELYNCRMDVDNIIGPKIVDSDNNILWTMVGHDTVTGVAPLNVSEAYFEQVMTQMFFFPLAPNEKSTGSIDLINSNTFYGSKSSSNPNKNCNVPDDYSDDTKGVILIKDLTDSSESSGCVSILQFGNYTLELTVDSLTFGAYSSYTGEFVTIWSASFYWADTSDVESIIMYQKYGSIIDSDGAKQTDGEVYIDLNRSNNVTDQKTFSDLFNYTPKAGYQFTFSNIGPTIRFANIVIWHPMFQLTKEQKLTYFSYIAKTGYMLSDIIYPSQVFSVDELVNAELFTNKNTPNHTTTTTITNIKPKHNTKTNNYTDNNNVTNKDNINNNVSNNNSVDSINKNFVYSPSLINNSTSYLSTENLYDQDSSFSQYSSSCTVNTNNTNSKVQTNNTTTIHNRAKSDIETFDNMYGNYMENIKSNHRNSDKSDKSDKSDNKVNDVLVNSPPKICSNDICYELIEDTQSTYKLILWCLLILLLSIALIRRL